MDLALDLSLHLGSPNHKLSFELFFWFEPIDSPSQKWSHVGLASIFHFLVWDLHLKAMGSIYGSQPIGLLYFLGPWNLDPNVKWPALKVSIRMLPFLHLVIYVCLGS